MDGIFDAILDSAVLLDKAGRITLWSAGASQLFGYNKRDVLGRSINLIYDRNYPFPKLIQEIQLNQKRWQEDTVFVRKNGLKGNCKSFLSPLPNHSSHRNHALLIHHNISNSKKSEDDLLRQYQATCQQLQQILSGFSATNNLLIDTLAQLELCEKRLRESELRFHLLAENATDVISTHTPDGTIIYVSPACQTQSGYNPEDLIGKNLYDYIHPDDQNKIRKLLTRKREIINNKPIVYRVKRIEGEYRWFESNVRLIIDEQRRAISEIQLASRDITDRVLDKKARLRGQQLAHVFRLSTMEEMASGMAHEISQPLAAIVNYTRGCIRHLDNHSDDKGQIRSIMEKAAIQAERAGEIVQRLKNFFCKGQLVKTSCKINNVIRETVSLMKSQLTQSKTKIETDFDKDLVSIFMDKIQIQQVVLNLMQNAIEAMQEHHIKDKRISIQTSMADNEHIAITISDSGLGFSKELVNKVFMPFFTTKAHGRGMGLAICRSIIEAHGGQFTINPNSNGKSWIRFTLPISI